MEERKFSVLLSVYEKETPAYLTACLSSVLLQTVQPDEIVMVEDGVLTEPLYGVLQRFEEACGSKFKRIRNAQNRGLGVSLQEGLAACTYELVARMDTDDLCAPDRFEKQLDRMASDPALSVIGSDIAEFDETPAAPGFVRHLPGEHDAICRYMKTRCPFNHVTVMFRKSHVQKAGGYLAWPWNEDYYLWIRMYLSGCKFANIEENLCLVRAGRDMYRRRGGWKYFKSEYRLQKFMYKNRIIGVRLFCINVAKRFIVQVLLPNRIRGWAFRRFAREKAA